MGTITVWVGERIPVLEKSLLKRKNINQLYEYTLSVIKGRWPEAEPLFVNDSKWMYHYAKFIIKGRWLEAESILLTDQDWLADYARWVAEMPVEALVADINLRKSEMVGSDSVDLVVVEEE